MEQPHLSAVLFFQMELLPLEVVLALTVGVIRIPTEALAVAGEWRTETQRDLV